MMLPNTVRSKTRHAAVRWPQVSILFLFHIFAFAPSSLRSLDIDIELSNARECRRFGGRKENNIPSGGVFFRLLRKKVKCRSHFGAFARLQ